jgi:hypothetical protein
MKRVAFAVGVILMAVVGCIAYFWFHIPHTDSNILNFNPSEFQAKADAHFFYSIGNELKNSDRLDPGAPSLLRGEIRNFLVSPDGSEIAVVANGMLAVVRRDACGLYLPRPETNRAEFLSRR